MKSTLPSFSPIAAFVCVTTCSGKADIVAFSLYVVGTCSGTISALDNSNNDCGTFSFNDKSNQFFSSFRNRSSETPYALIPRALQACCNSLKFKLSTPSLAIILSSAASDLNFILRLNRNIALVPIVDTFSTLHNATRCGRCKESRVISSSNSFENFIISSLVATSPDVRILVKKLENSFASSECLFLAWGAIWSNVSWKNFAISNLTFRCCFNFASF